MRALLALAFAALPIAAHAADFKLDDNQNVILSGPIRPGDSMRFKQFVDASEDAGHHVKRVALDSPGGYIDEAVGIAQSISGFTLDTVIGPKAMCASACGLIFAAGKTKWYYQGAKLGVHQSRTTDGLVSASGTDNETKWLAALRTPQPVIDRLSATAPTSIAWLTDDEVKSIGVRYVDAKDKVVETVTARPMHISRNGVEDVALYGKPRGY